MIDYRYFRRDEPTLDFYGWIDDGYPYHYEPIEDEI